MSVKRGSMKLNASILNKQAKFSGAANELNWQKL